MKRLKATRDANWKERNRGKLRLYNREYARQRLGITEGQYRPHQYKAD